MFCQSIHAFPIHNNSRAQASMLSQESILVCSFQAANQPETCSAFARFSSLRTRANVWKIHSSIKGENVFRIATFWKWNQSHEKNRCLQCSRAHISSQKKSHYSLSAEKLFNSSTNLLRRESESEEESLWSSQASRGESAFPIHYRRNYS